MSSKSIMYFNRGTKCIIRLAVSIDSMRKYWDGPMYVVLEGHQDELVEKICKKYDVEPIDIDIITGLQSLCTKPYLHRYSKTDLTMYLDSDTLVIAPIDKYFDYIEEHDFVTGEFAKWKTNVGGMISRRIKSFSKVADEDMIQRALDYGPAVNTGVNGWKPDAELLKHWPALTDAGQRNDCSRRQVDEVACQVLIGTYKNYVAGVDWGCSVKFGKKTRRTKIIHYHGNKHVWNDDYDMCNLWIEAYKKLCDDGLLDPNQCYADRCLRKADWRKAKTWKIN